MSDFPEDFFPPTRELLNDEKRSFCEGQLTAKECLKRLSILSNGLLSTKLFNILVLVPRCQVGSGSFIVTSKAAY